MHETCGYLIRGEGHRLKIGDEGVQDLLRMEGTRRYDFYQDKVTGDIMTSYFVPKIEAVLEVFETFGYTEDDARRDSEDEARIANAEWDRI